MLDDIAGVPDTPSALPLPQVPCLRRFCRALIDDPGPDDGMDVREEDVRMSRRGLTRQFRVKKALSSAWCRRFRVFLALTRQAQGNAIHEVTAAVGNQSLRAFRAMVQRNVRATRKTPVLCGSAHPGSVASDLASPFATVQRR